MKTKLLLFALAFGLMSSTCTPEEQSTITDECNCEKINYVREQTGWNGASPVYTFVESSRENATLMDCESETDDYTNDGQGNFYQIVCE